MNKLLILDSSKGQMMFSSLRSRLFVTFALLAAAAISACGVLAYRAVELTWYRQLLSETLVSLHASAGSIDHIERADDGLTVVRSLAVRLDGRVLIVTSLGRVLTDTDSAASAQGKIIMIDEIATALQGKPASAVYRIEGQGRFLYAAVPVQLSGKIDGALLGIISLEPLDTRLQRLIPEIVRSSISVMGVALVAAFVIAHLLSSPVRRMARAFESAPAADYRHRLPANGRGELARMARAFNLMAERLQRTEQARRDFVVDASRDLASPLQTIIDESAAASLEKVNRLAVHLRETVGGLLELATLEIQTDPLLLEETDFSQLMDRAIAVNKGEAAELSVAIIREDSLDVPVIAKVDAVRMTHAISGLIHYAIHASGEQKEVRLALSYDAKNVLFSVTSIGAFVAAEELPFMFERFLGRKTLSGGNPMPDSSGAGLPAARRVIELHEGSIEAKMGLSGGITFFARLPRRVNKAL